MVRVIPPGQHEDNELAAWADDLPVCVHHVERRHRQQLARSRLEPVARGRTLALRTMTVAAGFLGDTHRAAASAALDMAAERGRSAQFDRRHHAALDSADPAAVSLNIGRAMAAEHIRHLQGGGHGAPVSRAAPPPGPGDRTGFASSRSSSWQPACSAHWSTGWRVRAAPGLPGCRHRSPAYGWRSCVAACAR